ncbi:MAG: hypothetical protein KBT03_02820 [Bacteroidales bacterium]|nr:hypothetical protein [Candidatus Scybalousia scybalohippi]
MKFQPILEDKPIQFAFDNRKYFINEARSKAFGGDTFFFPPTYTLDQLGCGGYYYTYGYPYSAKKGKKSNCTYVAGCLHYWRTGQIEKSVIGSAVSIFDRYKGRKSGGKLDNTYIGNSLQEGDWLIFSDNKDLSGDGHIVTIERIKDGIVRVSEGAYSDKSIYEGKACIVYDLNLNDMYTGKRLTLRPKMPYSEYLRGVCHTGDVYDKEPKKDYEDLYYEAIDKLTIAEDKLNKIKGIVNEG